MPAIVMCAGASMWSCETLDDQPGDKPRPASISTPTGTWSINDSNNRLFNVVLRVDGGAVSTWWYGPAGATGERGTWKKRASGVDITWNDGWVDELRASVDGVVRRSWSPDAKRPGMPTCFGSAVRVTGERARFIGVFRAYDPQRDADYMLALNAAGMCARTDAQPALGVWSIHGTTARLTWPDGSAQELSWKDGVYLATSYSADAPDHGDGPFVIRTADGLPYSSIAHTK